MKRFRRPLQAEDMVLLAVIGFGVRFKVPNCIKKHTAMGTLNIRKKE